MIELKAQMVIMSHLSDAEANILLGNTTQAFKHTKFAKFMILQSGGDLNKVFKTKELDKFWDEVNK
jgi:hypothetical protein